MIYDLGGFKRKVYIRKQKSKPGTEKHNLIFQYTYLYV